MVCTGRVYWSSVYWGGEGRGWGRAQLGWECILGWVEKIGRISEGYDLRRMGKWYDKADTGQRYTCLIEHNV